MAESAEEIQKHVKTYLMVGAALFVFTGITVGVTYIDFGSPFWNYGVGIGIAVFKASLVALIFMHLNHERKLIYQVLVFTAIFVAGLGVLTMLAWSDPLVDDSFEGGYQADRLVETKN